MRFFFCLGSGIIHKVSEIVRGHEESRTAWVASCVLYNEDDGGDDR